MLMLCEMNREAVLPFSPMLPLQRLHWVKVKVRGCNPVGVASLDISIPG